MNKSEELKQEYVKKYIPKIMHDDNGFPVPSEYYVNALNDFLDEYAQQESREVAIEFGIWVKENQGREDFDFCRGDSDEYFNNWKNQQ